MGANPLNTLSQGFEKIEPIARPVPKLKQGSGIRWRAFIVAITMIFRPASRKAKCFYYEWERRQYAVKIAGERFRTLHL